MIAGPFAESSTSRTNTLSPNGDTPPPASGAAHRRIAATASVNDHCPRCCATNTRHAPTRAHRCPTT